MNDPALPHKSGSHGGPSDLEGLLAEARALLEQLKEVANRPNNRLIRHPELLCPNRIS